MFRGTIESASVHPREVVKDALRLNAAAVIFSHNHPSRNPEPSQDKVIMQRLEEALALVDARSLELSRLKKIASPSAFCLLPSSQGSQ